MLRASVGAYRRHVGIAALFLVGHQTGEALVPVLVGVVIDEAVTPGARVVLGDRDREREVGRPEADTDPRRGPPGPAAGAQGTIAPSSSSRAPGLHASC